MSEIWKIRCIDIETGDTLVEGSSPKKHTPVFFDFERGDFFPNWTTSHYDTKYKLAKFEINNTNDEMIFHWRKIQP